ncbi:MAG TPA: DUF268 domain-containing protein [Terriglobales bacterium]|nr:DUF268 domain-containing protein [Terriglobales bacterium]
MPTVPSIPIGQAIGQFAKRVDSNFGIRAWLRGEPRPPKGGFDLAGEKIIDWGWICVNLPEGRKRALEIGCGESPVLPAMLARGYEVTGVDFDTRITQEVSGFTFIHGDFNQLQLQPAFDVIVACSAIEHFGLEGRYGSTYAPDADLKAMQKIRSLLSYDGVVLLTVPVGIDTVHKPWHRVYGRERLPQLLEGFEVEKARFLAKQPRGPWYETSANEALDHPIVLERYALGELMLKRK